MWTLSSKEKDWVIDIIDLVNSCIEIDTLRNKIADHLVNFIPSSFFGSYFYDAHSKKVIHGVTRNLSKNFINSFNNHYYKKNPFIEKILHLSEPVRTTDIVPLKDFKETEYFRDFLAPEGLQFGASVFYKIYDNFYLSFVLWRSKGESDYCERDIQLFKTVSPYLRKAVHKALLYSKIYEMNKLYNRIADNLDRGLIIVDSMSKVICANRAARNAGFQPDKDTRVGDSLFDPAQGDKCRVDVYQYKCPEYIVNGLYSIILIENLCSKGNIDLSFLGKEHDLTSREIGIVELILQGHKNREIAERLFISRFTVNCHIRNIFRKMNVKSRTEIISKIILGNGRSWGRT